MFYLYEILCGISDEKKITIEVLKARGFLIDEEAGKFYLSDNASVGDCEYLDKVLEKYALGKLSVDEDFAISSRRCWGKYASAYNYKYKSLKPKQVEILISDNVVVEKVFELFEYIGHNGSEAGPVSRTWGQFVIEILGPKPDITWLEGYVALYVKAASACGVYTCFSCDGNHINGGKIYVYADYPSNIWHEYLWKYIVRRKFGDVPYIGNGINFQDTESQTRIYKLVYDIANYLYDNRIEIRKIKERTVSRITKKYQHLHSTDEIEAFYKMECEHILSDDKIYEGLK